MIGKKRYNDAVLVHFNDEARSIGSGIRPVVVLSIGPKWVRLRSPSNGSKATVTRQFWDQRKEAG